MHFSLNPHAEVPLYRQIMRQILDGIAGGRLKPGDKLASHRDLSEQLVIAPLTVKKAYDELEALGFIATQRGRGTFISERPPSFDRAAQTERIRQDARTLLSDAYLAGLRLSEVMSILRETDAELSPKRRVQERA